MTASTPTWGWERSSDAMADRGSPFSWRGEIAFREDSESDRFFDATGAGC